MNNLINNTWKKNSPEFKTLESNARFLGATRFGLSGSVNKNYFVFYE
jgi:hypothetical protein